MVSNCSTSGNWQVLCKKLTKSQCNRAERRIKSNFGGRLWHIHRLIQNASNQRFVSRLSLSLILNSKYPVTGEKSPTNVPPMEKVFPLSHIVLLYFCTLKDLGGTNNPYSYFLRTHFGN